MKGRIEIDRELCKGCGLCITVCRKEQIEISDQLNKKGYYPAKFKQDGVTNVEELECTGCALCGLTCPDVAIEVYREEKKKSKDDQEAQTTEQAEEG